MILLVRIVLWHVTVPTHLLEVTWLECIYKGLQLLSSGNVCLFVCVKCVFLMVFFCWLAILYHSVSSTGSSHTDFVNITSIPGCDMLWEWPLNTSRCKENGGFFFFLSTNGVDFLIRLWRWIVQTLEGNSCSCLTGKRV